VYRKVKPVPVAARSKAVRLLSLWVWIPPWAWIFVYCECCRSLRRADHSSRGALPTVERRVWSRNLTKDEAIPPIGPQGREKKKLESIFLRQFQCRNVCKG